MSPAHSACPSASERQPRGQLSENNGKTSQFVRTSDYAPRGGPTWVMPIRAAADSRQSVAAALSPGIRVIELHILGIRVELRSIDLGRPGCWPPSSWHAERTITVELDEGLVNRWGRMILMHSRRLLLSSEILGCPRRMMWRCVWASSMAVNTIARWTCRTSHLGVSLLRRHPVQELKTTAKEPEGVTYAEVDKGERAIS